MSKDDLVAGAATPTMQMFENVPTSTYNDVSYTMQPVNALPQDWSTTANGTMYFGMSGSPFTDGSGALDRALPSVQHSVARHKRAAPDSPGDVRRDSGLCNTGICPARQNGPMPLLACVNDPSCIGVRYPNQKAPLVLDAGNSGKVYGAWLHDGDVYLTTGTPLTGSGAAWYSTNNGTWKANQTAHRCRMVRPAPDRSDRTSAPRCRQTTTWPLHGANLTYPSIVVGDGRLGRDRRDTGRTQLLPKCCGRPVHRRSSVRQRCRSPVRALARTTGSLPPAKATMTRAGETTEPRRSTQTGTMWFASEYIASRCTSTEFAVDTTCGYTRSFYANWSTHITAVRPVG